MLLVFAFIHLINVNVHYVYGSPDASRHLINHFILIHLTVCSREKYFISASITFLSLFLFLLLSLCISLLLLLVMSVHQVSRVTVLCLYGYFVPSGLVFILTDPLILKLTLERLTLTATQTEYCDAIH